MPGGPPGHVDPRRRRVGFASPLIVEFRALRTLNARLACAAAEKEMRPAEHHPECLECSADFIYDYDKQEGEWGPSHKHACCRPPVLCLLVVRLRAFRESGA